MKRILLAVTLLFSTLVNGFAQTTEESAVAALERAARYFRADVSVQGSYLWTYSEDLRVRRGEEEATATQGWVQPPGTPVVGMALLSAFEATGDRRYLEAATETAHALAATQLESGGWDYRIEFDEKEKKRWYYRSDREGGDTTVDKRRNTTVFDDNNTQSALRLLMRVDTTLEGKDAAVRRAVEYGLKKMIEAQYPNGAWPQRYGGTPPDPARHPVRQARYPKTWSRTFPAVRYQDFYTFNDGAMGDVVSVLLEAHRRYGRSEYLDAARRGGDFMLQAQMPDPQPVWAQQYTFEMEPAWARKFEPPSVVTAESVSVIRTLMDLYIHTGDEKYRIPIVPAIEWFRRSRLPDGRWARFYELKTNRPLYFTRKYELVYTADDVPTHYSFSGPYGIEKMFAEFETLTRQGRDSVRAARARPRDKDSLDRLAASLEPQAKAVVAALDKQGRWVEKGQIETAVFNRNVLLLSRYIAAKRGKDIDAIR